MRAELANHLFNVLDQKATGRAEDLILDNRPRNVLFAGCLAPRPDAQTDDLESAEDFYARLAPSAIQLRFLVSTNTSVQLRIQPHVHTYYRVAPPFSAQERRTPRDADNKPVAENLVRAYRKDIPALRSSPVEVFEGKEPLVLHLGPSITESVAETVAKDHRALPRRTSWKVPPSALADPKTFDSFCARSASDQPPLPPTFNVDLEVDAIRWGEGLVQVTISIVNRSDPNEEYDKADYWEQTVFDAGVDVSVEGQSRLVPYQFAALPNSYRFDRDQWGIGVNCVAEVSEDHSRLRTRTIPVHRQKALVHRRPLKASIAFGDLSVDPIQHLTTLAAEMRAFRDNEWAAKEAELRARPDYAAIRGEFESDLADFERETKEFERGIELLKDKDHEPLLKAFIFMNQTFARIGERSREWRLFQLVFIVRNMDTLAARQWNTVAASQDVEVLWFPTGGGKTEAFLGLLVTALFFDRLRGRAEGTTGVLRLPLRLLSLQQFQRVVKIVALADQVRKESVSGSPFSVGYWIGQGGSPNKVEASEGADWAEDPSQCQRFRRVRKCPYCGSGVEMRFDQKQWRLIHHCTSGQCGDGGALPLYIVDDELYRFLPSVVVGTVDKLAAFGFQRRFSNLIGWPAAHCPQHGYTPRQECLVPGCKRKVSPPALVDPVPSLHIQDELHLLKEDLGAFDGHYETAVLGAQREVPRGKPWKIIAATATIEQYEWQAFHLYCKDARRFPSPGPTWGDTFYATTQDQLTRLFIGLLPFGRSHINSMVSVLWFFHGEILRLRDRVSSDLSGFARELGLSAVPSREEAEDAIRDYEVSLTYVLTRKAGDQMAESLATQVADYLREENRTALAHRSLTGQSTGEEIESILAEIERSAKRPLNAPPEVDAVVATSMISHGVDIDRFNFISFFGMPRMTAEYIQASSRVGRAHPGLVVVVFSPARERDRSHFHHFQKYHQYLERLVEPAAINRFARFAVKHTLPGLVIGYLINVLGRRTNRKLYMENELYAALYADKLLSVDDLVARVTELYQASGQDSGSMAADIRSGIERFANGLRKGARRTLWQQPDFRPMYSLRDVEEPVFFTPSNYSKDAFAIWMDRRRSQQGELGIQE